MASISSKITPALTVAVLLLALRAPDFLLSDAQKKQISTHLELCLTAIRRQDMSIIRWLLLPQVGQVIRTGILVQLIASSIAGVVGISLYAEVPSKFSREPIQASLFVCIAIGGAILWARTQLDIIIRGCLFAPKQFRGKFGAFSDRLKDLRPLGGQPTQKLLIIRYVDTYTQSVLPS
jgi:hypothetical protein